MTLSPIGIMSAMPQEAALIQDKMENRETIKEGCRHFVKGTLEGVPIVFSLSGVGKVSAANTATLLWSKYNVKEIIFTGVAGGGVGTQIGDIVIGSSFLQHDLDLRPLFPQFHVLSLNQQLLRGNSHLLFRMKQAADQFFKKGVSFLDFGIVSPRVHEGTIVSGDQFINDPDYFEKIVNSTKELLPNGFAAIEMEGAAVAQTCCEHEVPFVVMRSISDNANHTASIDFTAFMDKVASHYSYEVVKNYLQNS